MRGEGNTPGRRGRRQSTGTTRRRWLQALCAGTVGGSAGCISLGLVGRDGPTRVGSEVNAWHIEVDGGTAFLGAPYESYSTDSGASYSDAGAAYAFERTDSGWNEQARFQPDDPESTTFFGRHIDVDGDTAVVGFGDSRPEIAVYGRSGEGWSKRTELVPGEEGEPASYPNAVALDGGVAFIAKDSATCVYERSEGTWRQQGTLAGSTGYSVALDGARALLWVPKEASPDAVLVFERTDGKWDQQTTLRAGTGDPNDNFGTSIVLNGDRAVVGASSADSAAPESGSVYVFERSGGDWTRRGSVTPEDGNAGAGFGGDVALDGETMLVTASGEESPNVDEEGVVYVIEREDGTWTQTAKLPRERTQEWEDLSEAVALMDDTALVAAEVATDDGNASCWAVEL